MPASTSWLAAFLASLMGLGSLYHPPAPTTPKPPVPTTTKTTARPSTTTPKITPTTSKTTTKVTPAPTTTTIPKIPVSCQVHSDFGYASPTWVLSRYSDKDLDRYLTAMTDQGAGSIRLDVDWSVIEQTRGRYDFSTLDRLVAAVTRHGITPEMVIDYSLNIHRPS